MRMPIEPLEAFIAARQLCWALKVTLGPLLGYSVFSSSKIYQGFFTIPTLVLKKTGVTPTVALIELLWGVPITILSIAYVWYIIRDLNRDVHARQLNKTNRVWLAVALFAIFMSQASAFAQISLVSTTFESYFWHALALLYVIIRLFIRNRLLTTA